MTIRQMSAGMILCVVIAGAAAQAQPAGTIPLTLDELLTAARERAPSLQAARAELEVADAEIRVAGVLPNPSLEYEVAATARGEDHFAGGQHELRVAQPLLLFGQRGARMRTAEGARDAARARFEAQWQSLAASLRMTFTELHLAQVRHALEEAQLRDLEGAMEVVRQRVEAGVAARYDLVRLEVAAASVAADVDALRAEQVALGASLAAQVGRAGEVVVAQGGLPEVDLPRRSLQQWVEDSPAVRAAQAEVVTTERQMAQLRRERMPVPAVGLGAVMSRSPFGGAAVASLSLDLPVLDFGGAALQAASAEVRAAKLRGEAVRSEVAARLTSAMGEWQAREEALTRFEREALPRLQTVREMAEEAYRAGTVGILELLDAIGALKDLQVRHAELRAAVALAQLSALEAAGGAAPPLGHL